MHYKNCFDVIHISCVTPGIENYRKLMDEVAECLKTGGVYLTVEGDMNLHDEKGDLVPELSEGDPAAVSLTMSPLRNETPRHAAALGPP
ncbi:hypothetical protein FRC01_008020 [Tulasnella sp. 417]|nr:hypothetical protein FRC01_008020 [Tulasnella sp. 417]